MFSVSLPTAGWSQPATAPAPHPRPLRELNTDYFPLHFDGPISAETWAQRRAEVRDRILLAAGLLPLPTRTPLNAVIHGRVERDDYTIDRVFFESFPGHYVTGSLYLPKRIPPGGRMPGILSPHGHWPGGRFLDNGAGTAKTLEQLAIGAERFESGARAPMQARCVQLARMGCAVFFYDMLGYADSIQIAEHRSGRRPELSGREPGTYGLYSSMADLRLQSNFGLQTWNSLRALDFLLTVPGVDPTRLAATGASGGATQVMMLAAIDDRLTAAFPCVMVSTAMQGGCTCENACYLRINQGNVDIAAAFAPKPMGLTAADDWTKELESKGYPELQAVWSQLGNPGNLLATFNTHWKHNYNHVTRTTVYGFMNRHFNLGFPDPVLERDFVVSSPEEATVWTVAHPKPSGAQVGAEHEKALLRYWSEDSDRLLSGRGDLLARAWTIMVGREMPRGADVRLGDVTEAERDGQAVVRATVQDVRHAESVPCVFLKPKSGWNGTVALWLAQNAGELVDAEGRPGAAAQRLLAGGVAVAVSSLYLAGTTEQPMNPVKNDDPGRNDYRWTASYTYGYNHSLFAHRVHDAMAVTRAIQQDPRLPSARIILVGGGGAGEVAAAAGAMMQAELAGAVIDTEGFRFASLMDQWQPRFVPGAVKYGDVPGLLSLCEPLRPVVLGEGAAKGGAEAVASAVLKLATAPVPSRRTSE